MRFGTYCGRFPIWALGGCLFIAWMNGAFFTSALSGMQGQNQGLAELYWNLSLLGVFLGLAVHVILEKRFGQLCLRPRYVLSCSATVCAGTVFMLARASFGTGPAGLTTALDVLALAGSLATGFGSSMFYIAWTQLYAALPDEDTELAIPLAVALAQLAAILLEQLGTIVAGCALVALPAASALCLRTGLTRLGAWDSGTCGGAPHRASDAQPLLDARVLAFGSCVWLALSTITSLVQDPGNTESGANVLPFTSSFIALLALMLLYVNNARRLSLLDTARIVAPVMVTSLIVLLALPDSAASAAFLIARTASMFYWAIIWILCAQVVREESASATHVTGLVRGSIQGGALLSVPAMALVGHLSTIILVVCDALLVLAAFSLAIPAMLSQHGAPEHRGAGAKSGTTASDSALEEPPADEFSARCARLASRHHLSPREAEIAECLLRGRNLPYIRETLFISRNTINTHVRHIYAKMDIHSKQELINLFEQESNPAGAVTGMAEKNLEA